MEEVALLLVAIVSLVIGFLASRLLNSLQEPSEPDESASTPASRMPPDALHIWRDQESKNLVLQIGERRFHSDQSLPPIERKHMTGLLLYLQRWLQIPTPREKVAPARTTPRQTPSPPTSKAEPPSHGAGAPEIEMESIVSQIDDILQDKLTRSPLRDQAIRLVERPEGGMYVMVEMEKYEDVDAIPDEGIKAIIRAAVQEWEERQ